jgi:hypothetical protein
MSGRAVSAEIGGIAMGTAIAIAVTIRKTRTGWYVRFWVYFLV